MLANYDGRTTDHCTASGQLPLWMAACLLAIAAAIALLPLRQVVLVAGAVSATVLVLRWPWLILLPLAALLPITSGIRLGPASATDLLLAAAVGLWFVDGARRRTLVLRGSPVIALVAVYVGVLIVSAWSAANFGEAAREVIKWVELLVLLLVAPALLTRDQAPWVAAALVLGATAQAILGLYQFVFAIGPDYFRPAGTLYARLRLIWAAQSVRRLLGPGPAGGAEPGHLGLAGDRAWPGGALASLGLGGLLQREYGHDCRRACWRVGVAAPGWERQQAYWWCSCCAAGWLPS